MVDIYTQFGAYYGDVVTIHRNTLLALFALVLMGLGVPLAAAQSSGIQYQHSSGIVTLETEDLSLRVTGVNEVPHFHWWDPDSPTVDYHVMFVKFFEANDTNSNGVYDVETDVMVGAPLALPTADWEFSGFELEQEGDNVTAVHFNFTSTEEHEPRPMDTGESYGSLPEISQAPRSMNQDRWTPAKAMAVFLRWNLLMSWSRYVFILISRILAR